MNKKLKIVFTTLLVIMCICANLNSVIYAANPTILDDKIVDPQNKDDITPKLNTILGMLQVIATVLAVGTLSVLGIKYMIGSTEEKANYKKTMMPYVIGAVVIFSATTIANMVYNMVQNI